MIQQTMTTREEVLYKIFLDMHKTYDALDRGRYLDILTEYKVSPQDIRLLRRYWGRLTMVVRAGG